jgi:two-component system response regulator YesN
MLRAVVFDDEFIVLRGLERLINWYEYGIELVGTAKDGLSALSLFRELKPDIVMTDIRMPGMDGLQLIEIIREEAPDTMCIVFSGYNEFDYVKRAIKLGVVDYLEKPVTIVKICEGIQKAVDRIREHNEMSSLKQKWQQGMLEKATLNLLLQGAKAETAWAEQYGTSASQVCGITVIASSDESFDLRDSDNYRVVPIRYGEQYLHAVFHYDSSDRSWSEILTDWGHSVIGSGRMYALMADAPVSYKEALKALRYGKYLEDNGWTSFEDFGDSQPIYSQLSDLEEGILFDLRVADKEGLMSKLDSYLEGFKRGRLEREVVEMELLKLLFHGLEVAKETGGNMSELMMVGSLPHLELRELQTQTEMAQWLRNHIEKMIDWIKHVRQQTKHSAIEKALIYINDHFGRDLTQQEVAVHVHMNAAYFSLLFKEQMGISYLKYLTKLRVEKAKALLEGGVTTQEISEIVGYYHARHFTKVFKKQTGMTPGQYRSTGKS